jgi:hypothetical protein
MFDMSTSINNEEISLYKFRSSAQFGYAMDIILNRRLYCSPWQEMNDIQEGWGLPDFEKIESGQISYEAFYAHRKDLMVCSLSGTCKSHLMWAHYANGFDGLAIEVVVPSENVVPVLCLPDINESFPKTNDPEELAKESLRRKLECWEYEGEARVIQKERWFENIQVKSVIVGSRMDDGLFKTLFAVCDPLEIPVFDARFSTTGIEIGEVDESRRPKD